jgi:hypothetical protein
MEKMNAARPHFVRCIKPNKAKEPNCFEDDYVEAQVDNVLLCQCSNSELLYVVIAEIYRHVGNNSHSS